MARRVAQPLRDAARMGSDSHIDASRIRQDLGQAPHVGAYTTSIQATRSNL